MTTRESEYTVKVITMDELKYAINDGMKLEFNRQLDREWVKRNVDPSAINVIEYAMPHEHKGGVACVMHYRCAVILGTYDGPQSAFIDITEERFKHLPTATIKTADNGSKSVEFNRAMAA